MLIATFTTTLSSTEPSNLSRPAFLGDRAAFYGDRSPFLANIPPQYPTVFPTASPTLSPSASPKAQSTEAQPAGSSYGNMVEWIGRLIAEEEQEIKGIIDVLNDKKEKVKKYYDILHDVKQSQQQAKSHLTESWKKVRHIGEGERKMLLVPV